MIDRHVEQVLREAEHCGRNTLRIVFDQPIEPGSLNKVTVVPPASPSGSHTVLVNGRRVRAVRGLTAGELEMELINLGRR